MQDSEARAVVTQVRDPEHNEWSPAMAACRPKERAFILALLDCKNGAQAAREAGFGKADGSSSAETMARTAHRLLGYDRVISGLAEESKKRIRSLAPDAIKAIKEIINSPQHKDRLNAARVALDRVDPTIQKVDVTHEIKSDPLKTTLAYLAHLKKIGTPREVLITEFGQSGLDYYEGLIEKQKPIIEGEFAEVPDDTR